MRSSASSCEDAESLRFPLAHLVGAIIGVATGVGECWFLFSEYRNEGNNWNCDMGLYWR